MTIEFVFNLAGMFGVALYLAAYGALQLGWLRGSSRTYTLLNLAAALFVLISLYNNFNMASAIIQMSWITISIVGLVRIFLLHRSLRFTSEEEAFLEDHLPDLPRSAGRALLNAGFWVDATPDTELLTENVPVERLYYLASGLAAVDAGGSRLATVEEGFLGEINVVGAKPASATVRILEPSRLFVLDGGALRRLRETDSDLRHSIDKALSQDTGRKLLAANARIASGSKASVG